jgi:hypothetical protein
MLSDRTQQQLLAAAARRIDRQLARDPFNFEESRYDTVRVGFEPPLRLHYEVLSDVRTVIVYDVWRIDSKTV